MRLLVVEDDENKRLQIIGFITEVLPSADIVTAASYQSGVRALLGGPHDLILLDMTMRTYDVTPEEEGGRPQAYAGRSILRQMARRDIDSPVILITQFDRFGEASDLLTLEELDKQLQLEFPGVYRGAVYYNPAVAGWREALLRRLSVLGLSDEVD
jgi:CheY-like chemotaxis protein